MKSSLGVGGMGLISIGAASTILPVVPGYVTAMAIVGGVATKKDGSSDLSIET